MKIKKIICLLLAVTLLLALSGCGNGNAEQDQPNNEPEASQGDVMDGISSDDDLGEQSNESDNVDESATVMEPEYISPFDETNND